MSAIAVDSVLAWVADRYAVAPPLASKLIRAYTNDLFLVQTARGRCVLKVYGNGWRTEPEILYEVQLLDHLAAKGVLVARAIAAKDRRPVQSFPTPAGNRFAVLFTFAAGAKPVPPFTPVLYEIEGRAAAAMHRAADDFVTTYHRRPMDLTYLLDQPAALIQPLLEDPEARRFFLGFVHQLRRAIGARAARGLDWGPCHGDLTLDNFHITADRRIVWYDFDSGGPGWRAGDLQGWAAIRPEARARWEAFLRGYQDVRPLASVNVEAAPYLSAAFDVWGMAVDLQNRIMEQGTDATHQYLSESLDKLQPWASHLGFS